MNDKYAVEIKGITKKYGSLYAVNNLDLNITEGEIFGLLGPNGAGKTTIVKIICQLLKENSGTIKVDGIKIPDRRILPKIGYMPQDTALYNEITVNQSLFFFGELQKMSRSDIDKNAVGLLELVGLTNRRNSLISQLSGGMKRRVSLICSLIHNPKILLLDEPTVGVDPELRDSFWRHFIDLKNRGTTIIITTHYMDEANKCDRAGFMRDGEMIALDAPERLIDRTSSANLEEAFLKIARERKNVN